ncbi:hypothetical protein J6590_038515 [Homalodisca vitripennis]|nr:hypothetical protein J6590_038515 [Homalodisca vitripennis]
MRHRVKRAERAERIWRPRVKKTSPKTVELRWRNCHNMVALRSPRCCAPSRPDANNKYKYKFLIYECISARLLAGDDVPRTAVSSLVSMPFTTSSLSLLMKKFGHPSQNNKNHARKSSFEVVVASETQVCVRDRCKAKYKTVVE